MIVFLVTLCVNKCFHCPACVRPSNNRMETCFSDRTIELSKKPEFKVKYYTDIPFRSLLHTAEGHQSNPAPPLFLIQMYGKGKILSRVFRQSTEL